MSSEKLPITSREKVPAPKVKAEEISAFERPHESLNHDMSDPAIEREIAKIEEARIEATRERLGISAQEAPQTTATVDSTPPTRRTFAVKTELRNKLKALPAAERKEALAQFKKEIDGQREGLAKYRVAMETLLQNNPDTPKDVVIQRMNEFQSGQPFSAEQRAVTEEILDRYYKNRQRALKVRADFPNNVELVNHLTGMSLPSNASFEVQMGPMTIDIYAAPTTIESIHRRLVPDSTLDHKVDGFAASTPGNDPIYYSLINRTSSNKKGITDHELQHQKNKLFRESFDRMSNEAGGDALWNKIEHHDFSSEEDKKSEIRNYFRNSALPTAYDRAKDEIFAIMINSNGNNPDQIKQLFAPGRPNSNYDYLKSVREKGASDPVWKELSDEFLVTNYQKTINKALQAVDDLDHLYTKQETIAILSDIPLEAWSSAAARAFKERNLELNPSSGRTEGEHTTHPEGDRHRNENRAERPGGEHAHEHGNHGEGHREGHHERNHAGGHGRGHGGHGHGHEAPKPFSAKDWATAGGLVAGTLAVAGFGELVVVPWVATNWLGLAPSINAGLSGLGLSAGWFGIASVVGVYFGWNLLKAAWEERGKLLSEIPGASALLGGGGGGGGKKAAKPKAASGGGGDHGHGGGH